MRPRCLLRAGEMFVIPSPVWHFWTVGEVWIVIDAKTEIGFWRGAKAMHGDVMPSTEVLVVS